jgi:hypothetical protein
VSQQRPLWFQDWENPPPFIKALEEVRRLSCREGWCFFHVRRFRSLSTSMLRLRWETVNSSSTSPTASAVGKPEMYPEERVLPSPLFGKGASYPPVNGRGPSFLRVFQKRKGVRYTFG